MGLFSLGIKWRLGSRGAAQWQSKLSIHETLGSVLSIERETTKGEIKAALTEGLGRGTSSSAEPCVCGEHSAILLPAGRPHGSPARLSLRDSALSAVVTECSWSVNSITVEGTCALVGWRLLRCPPAGQVYVTGMNTQS